MVGTGTLTTNPSPEFDTCVELWDAGFPQKRSYGAMYYLTYDMLINIADLSVLKAEGKTDFENIFSRLIYKPTVEDMEAECFEFLQEIVKMADGSFFAYSIVEEDPALIQETGRTDKYIRARGRNLWQCLTRLYLAVHKRPDALIQALTTKPLAG